MPAAKPLGTATIDEGVAPPESPRQIVDEALTLLSQSRTHDAEAFRDPLAFLEADHVRQLRMCNLLDALSDMLEAGSVKPLAGALLEFIRTDLPKHTLDEERDIMPALRRRARPEDEIDEVLRQMSREHELDNDLVAFIVEDLEALADGRSLTNPVRLMTNAREFSEMQRRHLTWEDRVVLPIARRRLTPEDLSEIGRAMAARRGVELSD